MKQELISIIVPIYNVEKYLVKCLESVLSQTYRNLEIILVDDGSIDDCGKICDQYACMDSRIRVIHQNNAGVSAARNKGLSIATGKWIGWVDPDDWIEIDMFEYLLENAQKVQADISVCGRVEEYKDFSRKRTWTGSYIFSTEKALEKLLQDDVMQNYLWDKLFKRELFDNLWFWNRRTFEDISIMYKLFERASKVICLPDVKYHYQQREYSIVNDFTLSNKINHFYAVKLRLEDMKFTWPQFTKLLEAQCMIAIVNTWGGYYKNSKAERMKYKVELEKMSLFAKQYRNSLKDYIVLGITGKIILTLTPYPYWWSFRLAQICNYIYRIIHNNYYDKNNKRRNL